jgi:molybdopterin-guanine dinucleotide biosynthesis protein A
MVLTGGGSVRLGRDKATTVVAGRRMVDRVLDQIPSGVPVVVVGPDPRVSRPVVVAREDPPRGGPAAAIGAGIGRVETELVAVIAADMPWAAAVVVELLGQLGPEQALVPIADGFPQPLCAVYRSDALRAADAAAGMSMRELLAGLHVRTIPVEGARMMDIDTPADLERAERCLTIMGTEGKGRTKMQDWVDAVKDVLGLEADVDVDLILDVAKDAAHAVQRPAAPVTTYLLGLAVAAGADPVQAAASVSRMADGWQSSAADA